MTCEGSRGPESLGSPAEAPRGGEGGGSGLGDVLGDGGEGGGAWWTDRPSRVGNDPLCPARRHAKSHGSAKNQQAKSPRETAAH